MFKVEMDEENYRLVGPDGEEGPIVPYGQMATLTIGSAVYYANVEDGNEEAPKVCGVTAVKIVPAEVEDVQFEVTEEDEEAEEDSDDSILDDDGPVGV